MIVRVPRGRCAPWVHPDVVGNPIIEQVVAAALGKGAVLSFYNGHCNLSGSGTQPLHMESPWAWQTEADAAEAGKAWPPPATAVSVCIAVEDIDESNGADEIWPGSHIDVSAATAEPGASATRAHVQSIHFCLTLRLRAGLPTGQELTGEAVEERRLSESSGPTRLCIPKGSVAFVDGRLWRRVRNLRPSLKQQTCEA